MSSFDEYDDIVISGIGGRFPESNNLDELRDHLFSGIDMVTSDNPRWLPGELGVPTRTGKMKSLSKCDAEYFGLFRKQCNALDPITRQVLERTFEAILDAGLNPADLKGSNTGVFFGSSISEIEIVLVHLKSNDGYGIMGRNRALNANRVSYWLDLKGTSHGFDCTWANGLQGLEIAYSHIRNGLCDAAIVGCGSNSVYPNASKLFGDLNFLSPDGVTRSFDVNANGYARSEAVSVFLIQKAKDAKRSYGSIVHILSKSLNDGNGQLIAPRQKDWCHLYREFYEECKVDPNEVTFLEADGTACQESDVAELNAAAEFLCSNRTEPLLIGSVKTNLGHAEAAAGGCSLAKIAIAMQTGKIPPNLHYQNPNTKIPCLVKGQMKVVTEPTLLSGDLVAINAFGIGGTYAHILLKRSEKVKRPCECKETIPRLVLVSGRHEAGVSSVLDRIEATPYNKEYLALVNNVFSRSILRHMNRGYMILPPTQPKIRHFENFTGAKRSIWFIFSGMGSQWASSGKDLLELPLFKTSIDDCHEALATKGVDLLHLLTYKDESLFDNILHCFVTIAAVQVALVDVLRALKIEPDGIIGHSQGEIAAGYADGCFTKYQAMMAAYFRGIASLETPTIKGMMAAVGKGYEYMKDRLPDGIDIACHNGPDSCTLSGPSEIMASYVAELQAAGLFAKCVNVANIAYHSRYIQSMRPKLLAGLNEVIPEPKERSPRWLSSSVPETEWGHSRAKFCSAEYLANNLISPVLFDEACRHIPKDAITIELAPHGLLQAILKRSLDPGCSNIALTNRTAPNQQLFLLEAVGRLYCAGLEPEVNRLYPEIKYPVSYGTPSLAPLVTWDHSQTWVTSYSYSSSPAKGCKEFTVDMDLDCNRMYRSYKWDNVSYLPQSFCLILAWETYLFSSGKDKDLLQTGVKFRNIIFKNVLKFNKREVLTLDVMVHPGNGYFEVTKDEDMLVTGFITATEPSEIGQSPFTTFEQGTSDYDFTLTKEDIYAELLQCGHDYSEPFTNIGEIIATEKKWKCQIQWTGNLAVLIESFLQIGLVQSIKSDHLHRPSMIIDFSIDPRRLPKSPASLAIIVDIPTNTMDGQGVRLTDLRLMTRPRHPLKFSDNDLNENGVMIPVSEKHLKISYVENFIQNMDRLHLGYSGIDSLGRRVMGVSRYEKTSPKIQYDEVLNWQVPDNWTLEEAATVPVPYSLAYYAVHIAGRAKAGEVILITNGTSTLGRASISVASEISQFVYVVVFSKKEKDLLSQKFKALKDNIMVCEGENEEQFAIEFLLRVKGEGARVLIGTTPWRQVRHVLSCAASNSRVVQLFEDKPEDDFVLDRLSAFMSSCNMYGVSQQTLLHSRESDKKKLVKLMGKGIQSKTVTPLPKIVIFPKQLQENGRSNDAAKILRLEENGEFNQNYTCDSDDSFLIVGNEPQTWLQITEWFIKHQAKNVTIIQSQNMLTKHVLSRVKQQQELSTVTVKCVKSYDIITMRHILREVGKIAVVVVLPLVEDSNRDATFDAIKALDPTCREMNSYLITILRSSSRALRLCSNRTQSGFPTLTVLWDSQILGRTRPLLQKFDALLRKKYTGIIQIKDQYESLDIVDGRALLDESLPKDPEDVVRFAENLPDDVTITKLRTLSPKLEYTKETIPLFLLPGIHKQKEFIDRFKKSFYPVFVVQLPHLGKSSIQEYAAYIVPKIKKTTPGPYILIGSNWGGSVSLELGKQLENLGNKVHVFLLAGTTQEVLSPLHSLGEDKESLQIGLLARLLNIRDEETLQDISNQETWTDQLNYSTAHIKGGRRHMLTGLDAIKNRLEALATYSISHPINGPLTIVTKSYVPQSHLKELCSAQVKVYNLSREEELLNDDVFRMIHDSCIINTIGRERVIC